MSSSQKAHTMSEQDVETTEVSTPVPEEAAPVVEDGRQQDACADPAQVAENLGTQTPPLKGPETSELTDSPTTDSGYAEAALCQEPEEGEDQRALRAASLCALSPSPEFQSIGSTPSPERTTEVDVQPEFRGEDMLGTSSPAGDDNVYATLAATPPPALEGEDGPRTPTGTLSPVDEPQLRVSPKRKVENMDLDMDSSTELPVSQSFHAGSGCSSADEDKYQWDNIPPPKDTDWRLASRFPWGNETMVLGKPFSEYSHSVGLSPGRRARESECAAAGGESFCGGSTGDRPCPGETDSLYSAASDLTQVITSASPSQSQPVMMGARPKGSSCSVDSRHADFRSPPRENATERYRACAGRMMLHREDWTHYAQQDEARP